jgi:hypothetical protein
MWVNGYSGFLQVSDLLDIAVRVLRFQMNDQNICSGFLGVGEFFRFFYHQVHRRFSVLRGECVQSREFRN